MDRLQIKSSEAQSGRDFSMSKEHTDSSLNIKHNIFMNISYRRSLDYKTEKSVCNFMFKKSSSLNTQGILTLVTV